MRVYVLPLLCMPLIMGCRQEVTEVSDAFCERLLDMKTDAPIDMTQPPAKCAAAKGLPGDNVICIDFSSLSDQSLSDPPPAQLMGWSFNSPPNCWEIASSKLQVKSFGTFASTCGFTMLPINLNDADKQKYQTVILSMIQKVDLDLGTAFPNQLAQIYFGTAVPAFMVNQTSGTLPEQQITITLDKQKVPGSMMSMVKYLQQVQSGMSVSNKTGLQISSIAVNLAQ